MTKIKATGHYALYNLVRVMDHKIGLQKKLHPKTKIWKELLEMVGELREIQKDWAEQAPE